jgi:hypothetical protein
MQIAAAAILCGSAMCVATQLTAPGVAAATTALLTSSPTLLDLVTSASLMLESIGINGSGLMGLVSASLASWKMTRRTERLNEFYVEPLHVPTEEDLKDSSIQDMSELVQSPHAQLGLPVYFLSTGHCEKGLDFRYIWGAEGLIDGAADEFAGIDRYFLPLTI